VAEWPPRRIPLDRRQQSDTSANGVPRRARSAPRICGRTSPEHELPPVPDECVCKPHTTASARQLTSGDGGAATLVAGRLRGSAPPPRPTTLQDCFLWRTLPNGKADVNQGPMPMGSDMPFARVSGKHWRGCACRSNPLHLCRRLPHGIVARACRHRCYARVVDTRCMGLFARRPCRSPHPSHRRPLSGVLQLTSFRRPRAGRRKLYVRESIRLRGLQCVDAGRCVLCCHERLDPGSALRFIAVAYRRSRRARRVRRPTERSRSRRGTRLAPETLNNACTATWQLAEIPYGALVPALSDNAPTSLRPSVRR